MTDPLVHLGRELSAAEARMLADWLDDGASWAQALKVVPSSRRGVLKPWVKAAGLLDADPREGARILRAVEGAAARTTTITTVWTTPNMASDYGQFTSSLANFIDSARTSIVCSTYNFAASSLQWEALAAASSRPTVTTRLYMDSEVGSSSSYAMDAQAVAEKLPKAAVFRTKSNPAGHPYRSHAKFIAIDHQFVLITSANFSKSAEHLNVELGVKIESRPLTEQVEQQFRTLEGTVYERVGLAL